MAFFTEVQLQHPATGYKGSYGMNTTFITPTHDKWQQAANPALPQDHRRKKKSSLLCGRSQCKLQKASKATGINRENQNESLTLLEGEKNTHSKLEPHSQATSNNSKHLGHNIPRQQGHIAQQPHSKT